jgi:phosphoglycolate phosphatase-like HAD superfamily hydrolase
MFSNLIFDFDGVIVDSNKIRIEGFRQLYQSSSTEVMDLFIKYVKINHGLSRYKKINFYYEKLIFQKVDIDTIQRDANHYSLIVKDAVVSANEIPGARAFLDLSAPAFSLALVSSSDQSELRDICEQRGISNYFKAILGSPIEKSINIINLIQEFQWSLNNTVYIGDSVNDLVAANTANIQFIGFGRKNFSEVDKSLCIVENFTELSKLLLK